MVPVTVVSGFAGAGKTAFIEHIRSELRDARIAVLTDDGVCDLVLEIERLARGDEADFVIVECYSALEPFYTAEHLVYGDDRSLPPESIRIDTMVTVVDASRFIRDCNEGKSLMEIDLAMEPRDDRTIPEVLVEQVEFADVLVLNKTDLVSAAELVQVQALLARLNPRAKILQAAFGRVPVWEAARTGLFDFDATEEGAGWLAELDGVFDEVGEVIGVSSFTYFHHRPFHPIRFNELLYGFDLNAMGLIRAKGFIWIASRHHEIGIWALAGLASVFTYGGAWLASTPVREWPQDEEERMEIMKQWVVPYGDRRQEIAFIGVNMNEDIIRARLDECLLTSEEMLQDPDEWARIPDLLPDWHIDDDAEPIENDTHLT